MLNHYKTIALTKTLRQKLKDKKIRAETNKINGICHVEEKTRSKYKMMTFAKTLCQMPRDKVRTGFSFCEKSLTNALCENLVYIKGWV